MNNTQKTIRTRLKDFAFCRTMYSKVVFTFAVFIVVILFFANLTVTSTITRLVEDLIAVRLLTEMHYVEALINPNPDATWSIRDGSIYFGDVLLGDGTQEKANLAPFLKHEKDTKTLAYVFMLDPNAEPGYVPPTGNAEGYETGRYLRIAGSTKGPNGNSIVGTYITKNISDSLDRYGAYSGIANVTGGQIFCRYNALYDKTGAIIGAIVVGRSMTELNARITTSAHNITFVMAGIIFVCFIFITFLMSRWTASIRAITNYLQILEQGMIPSQPLHLTTRDEMSLISEGINRMVISLEENNMLRKQSETDALTGLLNRFAYNHYSMQICNHMLRHPEKSHTIAVEILDIDHFKEYNDNYGHLTGDQCIQAVAAEIQALASGQNIFAFRYGGDEFVLIYQNYTKEEVEGFARQLKAQIHARVIKHEYSPVSDTVTITQGICFDIFSPEYKMDDYLAYADKALYDAKHSARNNYRIVSVDKKTEASATDSH